MWATRLITQRNAYWNDFNPNRAYPEIDRRIRETYSQAGTARNKHKQYDMYKRFLRWASDRLVDDGIVAFITNRAYLDSHQDDGFRKIVAQEFSDIYVLDLGSDVRRNPKISGTTHNVFGIQTGVAVGFLVRDTLKSGECSIHYARRDDAELATDTLAHLRKAELGEIAFNDVTPDSQNDWLNQSNGDFERLMPLASQRSRRAANTGDAPAVFGLVAPGTVTARDEWVYDFDPANLKVKARFFADTYNRLLDAGDQSYNPAIKWSRNLRRHFQSGRRIEYDVDKIVTSAFRPYVNKPYFADPVMCNDLTRNHYEMFGPDLQQPNKVICFSGVASAKPFQALAVDKLPGFDTLEKTQCLPLYRYTADGQRVSNITEWGLRQFREHYGDDGITAEDIFAYTYAALHDPAYRQKYEVDLRREFPRLPWHRDFGAWARLGRELLDLHIGFESVAPYPLERRDAPAGDAGGAAPRPVLRVDRQKFPHPH